MIRPFKRTKNNTVILIDSVLVNDDFDMKIMKGVETTSSKEQGFILHSTIWEQISIRYCPVQFKRIMLITKEDWGDPLNIKIVATGQIICGISLMITWHITLSIGDNLPRTSIANNSRRCLWNFLCSTIYWFISCNNQLNCQKGYCHPFLLHHDHYH